MSGSTGIIGRFVALGPFATAGPTYNVNSGIVNTTGPVLPNGDLILTRGDSYKAVDGRALSWNSPTWPNLSTAQGVTLSVSDIASGGTVYINAAAGVIIDASTIAIDLTSAQTNAITVTTRQGIQQFRFSIEAVLASGDIATLLVGRCTVVQPA